MIKRDEEGFYFESKNGIRYELLEGVTIGGNKQYTSGIVFIMLLDPDYNINNPIVGYCFGIELSEGNKIFNYTENISEQVKNFEDKNFN